MNIVLSVGGRFHAFHLAEQLHKHGHLKRLVTTEPLRQYDQLPREKVKTWRLPEYIGYAWRKSHLDPFIRWNVVKDNLFDWWATKQIEPCDLFVGFANYSLATLRKLAPLGTKTVVECGSAHILYASRLLQEEYAQYGVVFQPISSHEIEKQCQEYDAADYIAVPSKFVRRSFLEMGIPPNKLVQVAYGVDLDHFKPSVKNDKVFRVLFVGSLSLLKGIPYLLAAWKQLHLPNNKAELCLIGPITKDLRLVLEKYKGFYRHLGPLPHHELFGYYSQASLFVFPSVEDGFGLVIAEAMACGLPVICSENTGGPDLVREGQDGFVVPIRNPERLAEKILYLYENPDVCAEMGKSAMQHVQEFTWDAYGDKIVAEYKRIVG